MALVLFAVSSQAQLLWRVSGKGLVKDSYIFGTMHTAPESLIDEVAGLNDAIKHCDIAISESGNDGLNPMEKKEFLRKMIAPTDSTLDNLLSPEDYRIVEAVVDSCFSSQGLSLAQLRILGLISSVIFWIFRKQSTRERVSNLLMTMFLTVPSRQVIPQWVWIRSS